MKVHLMSKIRNVYMCYAYTILSWNGNLNSNPMSQLHLKDLKLELHSNLIEMYNECLATVGYYCS